MTSSTAVQTDAVARARELAPNIAARALEAERLRRMPDETIAELSQSGLFSLMAPRRYGGDEASLETLVSAVIEVGKVCGSTAWTFCIYGIHNWLAGLFPEKLQDEMFGSASPALPCCFRAAGRRRVSPYPSRAVTRSVGVGNSAAVSGIHRGHRLPRWCNIKKAQNRRSIRICAPS